MTSPASSRLLSAPYWASLAVATAVFTGCGGSSSGGAAVQPVPPGKPAVLKGKVKIDSSKTPLSARMAPAMRDLEPNSSAFDAQDGGRLDHVQSIGGHVGESTDPIDFYRFGPLPAGTVEIRATVRGARMYVLRLEDGRAPAIPVFRGRAGNESVGVASGDHIVIGIGAETARDYRLDVGLRSGNAVPAAALDPTDAAVVRAAFAPQEAGLVPGEVIAIPVPGEEAATIRVLADFDLVPVENGGGIYRFRTTRGQAVAATEGGRGALADKMFAVRRAAPGIPISANFIRKKRATPNDPLFQSCPNGECVQWGLRSTNTPDAWNITKGKGIVIAVIDGGFLLNHPDLKRKFLPDGYDFDHKDDNPQQTDAEGLDEAQKPGATGDGWHGSHLAGVAAADTNNNLGMAGVAWDAMILPIQAEKSDFEVSQGILYASGLDNSSGRKPKNPAHILSMSFGGPVPGAAEGTAIKQALAAGKVLVAAGGNSGETHNKPEWPAAYEGVIAVAAVDSSGKRAVFSNKGSYIDIAAPGQQITSCVKEVQPDGSLKHGYFAFSGTSQATPFIAGTCAMILSVNPKFTRQQVTSILRGSATDAGPKGFDPEYGAGLVDVLKAVQLAGAGKLLTSDQTSIRPRNSSVPATTKIKLTNTGATVGAITGLIATASTNNPQWLSASLSGTSTPADLTVTFDLAKMAPGAEYHGAVTVKSNDNTSVVIPVFVRTAPPATQEKITVTLLNDKGDTAKDADGKALTAMVKDDLTFEIQGVPKGQYLVQAGIDANKNGKLSDVGDWTVDDQVSVGDDKTQVQSDGVKEISVEFEIRYLYRIVEDKF